MPHANHLDRLNISEDLGVELLQRLQRYIENRTGPKVVAEILAQSKAHLFDFEGPQGNETAIAQWLSRSWG